MAADRQKWISIMVVPEDGAGMRKWRITSKKYSILKIGFWVTGFFLLIGFVSMISVGVLFSRLKYYKEYNSQLIEATTKLDVISERLERYQEKESKLRGILGSDLDLPEAMVAAPDQSMLADGSSLQTGTGSELDMAIAKEEAKLRRLPTLWPVETWQVTKIFVDSKNPRLDHHGIDLLAADKSGILVSGDGKIVFAGHDKKLGRMIIVDHGNGWETRYGHLASILVKPGEEVKKGNLIAVYGESEGVSTGAHLHFAMSYQGQAVDPLKWLEKKAMMTLVDNQ